MLEEEIEINVDGWNLMVFGVNMRRYVWPTIFSSCNVNPQ